MSNTGTKSHYHSDRSTVLRAPVRGQILVDNQRRFFLSLGAAPREPGNAIRGANIGKGADLRHAKILSYFFYQYCAPNEAMHTDSTKKAICFQTAFSIIIIKLLSQIKSVRIHHLGPGGYEIIYKLILSVFACINFGNCPEFGVGAQDQIQTGTGPLDFA